MGGGGSYLEVYMQVVFSYITLQLNIYIFTTQLYIQKVTGEGEEEVPPFPLTANFWPIFPFR